MVLQFFLNNPIIIFASLTGGFLTAWFFDVLLFHSKKYIEKVPNVSIHDYYRHNNHLEAIIRENKQ